LIPGATGTGATDYVNSPDGSLIAREQGSSQTYALTDGQGNVTAIADSDGLVVERYMFTPEGKVTFYTPRRRQR